MTTFNDKRNDVISLKNENSMTIDDGCLCKTAFAAVDNGACSTNHDQMDQPCNPKPKEGQFDLHAQSEQNRAVVAGWN